ncbi:MAG: T9SS type A sorting domain-containing protein [Bacteroides sp.]|nr:T9SS type A sorting domain-containing protein [Bacteroides sp.]
MKRVIFAIIYICLLCPNLEFIKAEILINRTLVQNGENVSSDDLITSVAPLQFSLVDKTQEGVWSVSFLEQDGFYVYERYVNKSGNCIIDVTEFDFWRVKKEYNPDIQRNTSQMRVRFTCENGNSDYIDVSLALAPTRPVITNIKFDYVYDWDSDSIWPNGWLSFDIYSQDANKYYLHSALDQYYFEYNDDILFLFTTEYKAEEGITHIVYQTDWGEFIIVTASNRYGYTTGDMLFTTSFIEDQNVLNRIEELRLQAETPSVIEDKEDTGIKISGNTIQCDEGIHHLTIYDLNGRIVRSEESPIVISLSDINKGIYVVTYQYKESIKNTKIVVR